MHLPQSIPQFFEQEEPAERWSTFLLKAAKGSVEAVEILTLAQFALAARLGGPGLITEGPAEECDRRIAGALPERAPFSDLQQFLDTLFESRYLSGPMAARPGPFRERTGYDALWRREVVAPSHQLVHDAAFYCVENWSGDELLRLAETAEEEFTEYNSLDAVAAMLFWAVAWATSVAGET
jgi:hypothetical protein